jgi:two-component system KDP operon response regulator KdpE
MALSLPVLDMDLQNDTPRIVLVEDDAGDRGKLRAALTAEGYACVEAASAEAAINLTRQYAPDLVLLALGSDGVGITSMLRAATQTPIVVVSEQGDEDAKVRVLDSGADDYVTKPFGPRELLARVRAVLRRAPRGQTMSVGPVLNVGPLKLDLDLRRLTVEGRDVSLTPKELALLTTFMRNAGRVMSSERLFEDAWGTDAEGRRSARARAQLIRVYVLQLRQKIESDPSRPQCLVTETGVGYRLRGA